MKKLVSYFFICVFATPLIAQQLIVRNPRCEYKQNPVGVDVLRPRFSWELRSNQQNILQAAYRILVADDTSLLHKNTGNIWDSKKISSSQSIQIKYNGKVL
ncbi:MAG TPA: hypothetical protein VJ111_18580, partial [Chitinophagaceae bacterium]|nr:hypothetical protein [Chitinophagaceae bacterium]